MVAYIHEMAADSLIQKSFMKFEWLGLNAHDRLFIISSSYTTLHGSVQSISAKPTQLAVGRHFLNTVQSDRSLTVTEIVTMMWSNLACSFAI